MKAKKKGDTGGIVKTRGKERKNQDAQGETTQRGEDKGRQEKTCLEGREGKARVQIGRVQRFLAFNGEAHRRGAQPRLETKKGCHVQDFAMKEMGEGEIIPRSQPGVIAQGRGTGRKKPVI